MSAPTRAEICAAAVADVFRDAGEVLASCFGVVPSVGARLARLTFAPDLLLTDGIASLRADVAPVSGEADAEPVVEGWLPFRRVFDLLWSGRRELVMMASQLDAHGNQNFASIGDPARPKVQLLGMRGAPGNTLSHPTSYWVPDHSKRVFVERVDVVSGVGTDRAAALGPAGRFHVLRRVVTNLAVLDFETPERRMRLASLHPGVEVEEVVERTGFELVLGPDVPETRLPTAEELRLMREVVDPEGLREREVRS